MFIYADVVWMHISCAGAHTRPFSMHTTTTTNPTTPPTPTPKTTQEEALFDEMKEIQAAIQPDNTVFVMDATQGTLADCLC